MTWAKAALSWCCYVLSIRNRLLRIYLIILLFPTPTSHSDVFSIAYAGSGNSNLGVSATVNKVCVYTTSGGGGGNIELNFDTYDATAANTSSALQTSGEFDIKCTRNTTAQIMVDNGENPNGTQRRMTDGLGNYLEYNLYQNASRTVTWTEASTVEVNSTTTAPQTIPMYADVPANQDVSPGTYYDTVIMTTDYE